MRLLLLLLVFFTVPVNGDTCGSPSSFPSHSRTARHIIGGNEAPMGKWPWQVMLRSTATWEENGLLYQGTANCGGTVISKRWILSAAHCFKMPNATTYALSGITHGIQNETDRMDKEKPGNHRAQNVFVHPNYTMGLHDIALVKLEAPITFDASVSPICLPRGDQWIPKDGQAVVVGFGDSNERGADDSRSLKRDLQLRDASVPLLRINRCKSRYLSVAIYESDKDALNKLSSVTHLCAGSFGHGTAEGDSGGPLLMPSKDGRWFQIGITSYGNPNPRRQDVTPGVYTSVRKYCKWIKQTTNGEASCRKEKVTLKDPEIVV